MDWYITTSHHKEETDKEVRSFGMGFLILIPMRRGGVWDLGIKHTNFKKGKKGRSREGSPRVIGIYGFSVICLLG